MSSKKKRERKLEIVFDPDARKEHLRGFSERKRQRRAFGLAMQKVKDRSEKIEQRKKEKKDQLERVLEAERQKETLLEEELMNSGVLKDGDDDDKSQASVSDPAKLTDANTEAVVKQKQYDDLQGETKWGGHVTVTTAMLSLDDLSDDDDDSDTHNSKKKKAVDHQQKKAGDVQKYLDELKGNLPGKRKQTSGRRMMTKGKNGAAEMRGMGGSSNLKMAQKVLGKAKAKIGGGGIFSKKGKKRKGKG